MAVSGTGWRLARAFEARAEAEGIGVVVFNFPIDAAKWLGVDPQRAAQVATDVRAEIRSR
jgi:hypothetical protein